MRLGGGVVLSSAMAAAALNASEKQTMCSVIFPVIITFPHYHIRCGAEGFRAASMAGVCVLTAFSDHLDCFFINPWSLIDTRLAYARRVSINDQGFMKKQSR